MFKNIFLIFFALVSVTSVTCAFAESKKLTQPEKSTQLEFGGWNLVAKQLIKDGVNPKLVKQVLESVPAFEFIPFKLKPVEGSSMYNLMTETKRIDRAAENLKKYKKSFHEAEHKFGVTRYAIAAIISVETNWGTFTGDNIVLYRLLRIASTLDPSNVNLNYKKHQQEDASVALQQTEDRAKYLFDTFYPQILAIFKIYDDQPDRILELKGSVAGAFGLPQFLPLSYQKYALDGNADGKIDLMDPEDAIMSVANFLKAHGWRKLMPPQEKLKVLWHYNRSDAYGRAIIKVALNLQSRDVR
jgi:membrane-bound lytic murein transglycosylase B